jgi:glycosyltransferase involved in cell wall biosynthesis
MPFFSIIIPTYNRATFLERTITSVLSQEYKDWELLLIDDASTDNTKEIVASFDDARIRYIKNEVNLERSASRNKGVSLSKGQYICFLDSDDVFRNNHLQVLNDFLEKNKYPQGFIFTNSIFIYDDTIKEVTSFPQKEEKPVEWILKNQLPPILAICLPKSILDKYRFNEKYTINEDLDLWARIVSVYPWYHININTVEINIHGENSVLNQKNPREKEIAVFKALCRNAQCQNQMSKQFKKQRLQDLRTQRITILSNENRMNIRSILLFYLLRYPFAIQNKHRFYLLLERISVTRFFVRMYSSLKQN